MEYLLLQLNKFMFYIDSLACNIYDVKYHKFTEKRLEAYLNKVTNSNHLNSVGVKF